MLLKFESIKKKQVKRVLEHAIYLAILVVLIPGFFYFEVCIVLPAVVEGNTAHVIHMCCATFLLLNIVGNMIFGMLTNTSINGRFLQANKQNWTMCLVCECQRPPRAWHCDICNTCILKRDHHCTFFACCVGYYNHRYFMLFTLDIFVSMIYAFYFNVKFLALFVTWNHGLIVAKFVFPLASVVLDFGYDTLYIFLVVINVIVGAFTGFLFFYHLNNLLKGRTAGEGKVCSLNYNKGWKSNVIEVFGTKWYLTWILPFIDSPLPGNGIDWSDAKCK